MAEHARWLEFYQAASPEIKQRMLAEARLYNAEYERLHGRSKSALLGSAANRKAKAALRGPIIFQFRPKHRKDLNHSASVD